MKITLNPKAALPSEKADYPPIIHGDTISYRGESYDLSPLADGSEVEAEKPFVGKINRSNGQLHLSIEYIYDADKAERVQSELIEDYTFVVSNGQCPCPIKFKQVQAVENDN